MLSCLVFGCVLQLKRTAMWISSLSTEWRRNESKLRQRQRCDKNPSCHLYSIAIKTIKLRRIAFARSFVRWRSYPRCIYILIKIIIKNIIYNMYIILTWWSSWSTTTMILFYLSLIHMKLYRTYIYLKWNSFILFLRHTEAIFNY